MSESEIDILDTDVLETTEEPIADPIALVSGEPLNDMPTDLFIPPDALRVFLESFEGPLDLLLYLIQRQNLDIFDIPIADVTRQYLTYIELMQSLNLDLAAEYLVMAAVLMEIKSRLLLPRDHDDIEEEDDPRAALVRQLQEYALFKKAAQGINALPRVERDFFPVAIDMPDIPRDIEIPDVSLSAMLYAMQGVMERAAFFTSHQISREPLSVRERMSLILERLKPMGDAGAEFTTLFTLEEGNAGAVVTLLGILELTRESLLTLQQSETFGQIMVYARQDAAELTAIEHSEYD